MQDIILFMVALIVSVVLHENAHGLVALRLGDTTARDQGRLTLNPVPHIDVVGSIILPLFVFVTTGGLFGYAKPVPISPWRLRGRDRWGFAAVAIAGPVSNILLAIVALLFLRVFTTPSEGVFRFVLLFFELNIFLAAFNLVPIPPLDGSRLIRPLLSDRGRQRLDQIEPAGFVILLVLLVWLSEPFFRFVTLIRDAILAFLGLFGL